MEKFKIYCLINDDRKDEAQLVFDLLKERGLKDSFFENKISFLLGTSAETSQKISAGPENKRIGPAMAGPMNLPVCTVPDCMAIAGDRSVLGTILATSANWAGLLNPPTHP